jgi:endonuclease/exonuclease/phosphatase family metal-dependent hydrolase
MKIYSWNVWDDNKTPELVLEFIQQLDFDIVCLQEVPESLLKKLNGLPYAQVHFVDLTRLRPKKEEACYLVILTRYQIIHHGSFFTCPKPVYPLRTRAFLGLGLFGFTRLKDHGALYADIQIPGRERPVRVFSLHLRLNGPVERKRELAIVASHMDKAASTIVCGDFNIIDQPLQKSFSWLLGSSIREAVPWYPERRLMETQFGSLGLKNVLHGQRTNTRFANQLDHILVPKAASVTTAGVCENSFGSDHYPVYTIIENF